MIHYEKKNYFHLHICGLKIDPTYWTFFLELDFEITKSLLNVSLVNDNQGQWERIETQTDENVEDDRDEMSTLLNLSLKTPEINTYNHTIIYHKKVIPVIRLSSICSTSMSLYIIWPACTNSAPTEIEIKELEQLVNISLTYFEV